MSFDLLKLSSLLAGGWVLTTPPDDKEVIYLHHRNGYRYATLTRDTLSMSGGFTIRVEDPHNPNSPDRAAESSPGQFTQTLDAVAWAIEHVMQFVPTDRPIVATVRFTLKGPISTGVIAPVDAAETLLEQMQWLMEEGNEDGTIASYDLIGMPEVAR